MIWRILLMAGIFLVSAVSGLSVASVDRGKEIYWNYCVSCHGEAGDMLKNMGIDFSNPDFWAGKSDEEIEDVIENGKGDMPPWKNTLSSDDIDYVILYMKSLAKDSDQTVQTPSLADTDEVNQKIVKSEKSPGFEIVFVALSLLIAILFKRK